MKAFVQKKWFRVAVDFKNGECIELFRFCKPAAVVASVCDLVRDVIVTNDTDLESFVIMQVTEDEVPYRFRGDSEISEEAD